MKRTLKHFLLRLPKWGSKVIATPSAANPNPAEKQLTAPAAIHPSAPLLTPRHHVFNL
ncbi:hypothetical protein KZJ38_09170 [Paraburkholderia edwinii]|uniref:Uncharacterized protein n=1 Tax=Paraburkholderia edwinii TaxID=2861782 RepID=A0ABX8UTW1_9BURK|nr:hypothetical protein [Paraburkholderia edwinii]QYD70434.1 hypothetical protein KZJ38_09170 [Paraburkholderia edwinii]